MKYQNMIGDGQFPNYYWVFHYDEKFKRDGDDLVSTKAEVLETKDNLLGKFKTYREALNCVNNEAYFPHVVIEDRLTGVVFETLCIVCGCCGKEKYETWEDIKYTKKVIEENGKIFQ